MGGNITTHLRPITMGLSSAGSHKKNTAQEKRILKIGLLEHEMYQIKVQRLSTFVLNYKDICRLFQNILHYDQKSQIKFRKLWVN